MRQGPKCVAKNLCRPYIVCVVAFLSPLRGLFIFHFSPTAYAVGFILAPLRAWTLGEYWSTVLLCIQFSVPFEPQTRRATLAAGRDVASYVSTTGEVVLI